MADQETPEEWTPPPNRFVTERPNYNDENIYELTESEFGDVLRWFERFHTDTSDDDLGDLWAISPKILESLQKVYERNHPEFDWDNPVKMPFVRTAPAQNSSGE